MCTLASHVMAQTLTEYNTGMIQDCMDGNNWLKRETLSKENHFNFF